MPTELICKNCGFRTYNPDKAVKHGLKAGHKKWEKIHHIDYPQEYPN